MIRFISALLISALVLSGCSSYTSSEKLTPSERKTAPVTDEVSGVFIGAQLDFSAELFRRCAEGHDENPLISPLSVTYALAMCANGAKGDTLGEIEGVLGMSCDELSASLSSYTELLRGTGALYPANSVWLRDHGLTVNDSFICGVNSFFDADVFASPFDSGTVNDINRWVRNATDGMIDGMISDISPAAMVFLINALSFDSEWEQEYEKSDIYDAFFTSYSGGRSEVSMMRSSESLYLTDGTAKGFIRPYKGGDFSFAALLPDEDTDIFGYAASLTGERLSDILGSAAKTEVTAAIPEFTSEYGIVMNDVLIGMGMPSAFEASADFSDMAVTDAGGLYIGEVLHKSFIEVSRKGTRAAAVTSVMMECGAAPEPVPGVILSRPFVYMIIENSTGLPVFMGIVTEIGE